MYIDELEKFNPWWRTGRVRPELLEEYKRKLYTEVLRYLDKRQILLMQDLGTTVLPRGAKIWAGHYWQAGDGSWFSVTWDGKSIQTTFLNEVDTQKALIVFNRDTGYGPWIVMPNGTVRSLSGSDRTESNRFVDSTRLHARLKGRHFNKVCAVSRDGNRLILHLAQRGIGDVVGLPMLAGFDHGSRTKEGADMVGAGRQLGAHAKSPVLAMIYTMPGS